MPEPVPIKWPIRVKDWGFEDKLIDSDHQAIASDLDDATIDELVDVANRGREAIELLRKYEWDTERCMECQGIDPRSGMVSWEFTKPDEIGHAPGCALARLIGSPTR